MADAIRVHTVCARCGAEQREERQLGRSTCSAWGTSFFRHMWTYPCEEGCGHA